MNMPKQPIYNYYEGPEGDSKELKYFKGQDLQMICRERTLRPEIEEEIKQGFFEIKKRYDDDNPEETVQCYVSHLCLYNYHPIFCRLSIESVKLILHYSSIVYLESGQTLYADGFNSQYFYIILFGRLRIYEKGKKRHYGQTMNLGWTIGEEILFRGEDVHGNSMRTDSCKSQSEAGVLGIEKRALAEIKNSMNERGLG